MLLGQPLAEHWSLKQFVHTQLAVSGQVLVPHRPAVTPPTIPRRSIPCKLRTVSRLSWSFLVFLFIRFPFVADGQAQVPWPWGKTSLALKLRSDKLPNRKCFMLHTLSG
jgi:hypothetical protein